MQLKIQKGAVELSGEKILRDINFEVKDNSRIAVVGRNGCGKTTLLRLLAGEYTLAKEEKDTDSFMVFSNKAKIGMLSQMTFSDDNVSLVEEIRSAYSDILKVKERLRLAQAEMESEQTEENIKNYTNLLDVFTNIGGFYFEKEYESAIKSFGFSNEEKLRPLYEFSGGQRTKIAFLKLLLSKPDLLLLDEPTNHLDIEAVEWLEEYLNGYKKAFVLVSHDRMFLDNVVTTVYEIEHGKTYRYEGNYTSFSEQKKKLRIQQEKDYEAQKKEIARIEETVERFRYKATKASMAQSKIKQLEHMTVLESPEAYDLRTFKGYFTPPDLGVKDMLSVKALAVGYNSVLSTVNLEVHKGDKIGIIGGNGLGKSTFIKTLVGQTPPIAGEFRFSPRATVGYFDQQMAQYKSNTTVLEDFLKEYPSSTDFEARSALGAFLFSGDDVFKTVNMLSGGERVRLALCKIFYKKPNFLILDEPTNHMDIIGKETLEDIIKEYEGTLIFVSHDRYFIKQTASSVLDFKKGETVFYPFGYEEYLQKHKAQADTPTEKKKPREKKSYTTPAKERTKKQRRIKKAEALVAKLEEELALIDKELSNPQNSADYIKLSTLQDEQERIQRELDSAFEEWEAASEDLENIGEYMC